MAAKDLDGNGIPELLLTGVSNGYNAATLVVLDPLKMSGASKEELPKFQILDQGDPVERARLLFPAPANLARRNTTRATASSSLQTTSLSWFTSHRRHLRLSQLPLSLNLELRAPKSPTPPKLLSVSSPPAYAQLLDPNDEPRNSQNQSTDPWH